MTFNRESPQKAKVDQLRRDLSQHPGQIAKNRWEEISRSTAVFYRNTTELHQLILLGETDEMLAIELVQNVRPPTVRDDYVAQLDQRLHNMLSAAVTLVDHTRRLMQKYKNTSFFDEFNKRNDIIRDSPETGFLRALRNYLLHYGMAPFGHTVRITPKDGVFESKVLLRCGALLAYDGWSSVARTYIETAGDSIRLLTTVENYASKVSDLYKWLSDQFDSLHGEDIDGANELVRQINLTMTNGASDGSNWPPPMSKAHLAEDGDKPH